MIRNLDYLVRLAMMPLRGMGGEPSADRPYTTLDGSSEIGMTSGVTGTLSRREFAAIGAMIAGAMMPPEVFAQSELDAIPEGPLRDHILWFIGVLNDPDRELTDAEVGEHFSPDFLEHVPADQVIGTVEQLRPLLGTVTVGRIGSGTDATQAGIQLLGETGERVRLTLWIEPDSDLIGGMLIEPDAVPATPGASAAAAVVASPVASPVVAAPAPVMNEVLPAFNDAEARLLTQGRALTEALLAGDDAVAASLVSPDVIDAVGDDVASAFLKETQRDIVHMEFPEVDAVFDGHVTNTGMKGFFYQQGPGAFQLAPEETQSEVVPSGRWSGQIGAGGTVLDIEVTFSGTAEALAASLSIPSQYLQDHPLTNVRFDAERPLGDRTGERALPLGQPTNHDAYSAAYAWGGSEMVISASFTSDGLANALSTAVYPPLPPDPTGDTVTTTQFGLPFNGTWLVLWGGNTEFLNYHAAVPAQRHAYDIVIWQDGATYAGDGTRNEQYHAWSQPVLAPADGTVVEMLDGQADLDPNVIADPARAAEIDPTTHPAGNHVVIETGPDEYLLLAHFQQGTVAVAQGDVVTAGDVLGLVGSSGNSSEPHIHIHLQDQVELLDPTTIGLPLPFSDYVADGEPVESGMPQQGELIAPAM